MELKFTFFLLFFSVSVFCQDSVPAWDSLYATQYEEVLHDVKWLPNGNRLIAVGEAQTKDNKKQGVFYCIDAVTGRLIERKYFGGLRNDVLLSVAEASNGTFLLVGYSESSNPKNGKDGWIIRLDEKFEIIKEESARLASPGDDELQHIVWDKFNNRGVIVGTKKANEAGRVWLLSISPRGTLTIDKNMDTGDGIAADVSGINVTRNGKIWIYGNTRNSDYGGKGDVWYCEMNAETLIGSIRKTGSVLIEEVKNGNVMYAGELLLAGTIDNSNDSKDGWATLIDPIFDKYPVLALKKEHLGNEAVKAIAADGYGRIYALANRPGGVYLLDLDKRLEDSGQNLIGGSTRLQVSGLIKTYDNFFICAGTDKASKQSRIRLMKIEFHPAVVQKKSPELTCSNFKFDDSDGNDVLTASEYGSLSFVVQNKSDESFPGGKYQIKQESPGITGLSVTNGTTGYLEFIGGKSSSIPLSVGLRAGDRVESGKAEFIFQVEGYPNSGCKLIVETGTKKTGTTYSYNKPAIRNNSTREVPLADNIVELEIVIRTDNPNLKKENIKIDLDGLEVSTNKAGSKLEGGNLENGQYEYRFEYTLRNLPEGKRKLRVYSDLDHSFSDPIFVNYKGSKPNLHIVAIGPTYNNLSYTAKDARDFTKAMYSQLGTGFFDEVFVDTLIGETANATAINKLMENIANRSSEEYEGRGKIKANDYLVLFYSGHGTKINNKFCLEPAGYDPNYKISTTVKYQEIINDFIARTGCKAMIFIDACLSGAATKSIGDAQDLSDLIIQVNQKAPGITSFSSCSENESSYETVDKDGNGNGVFTKALLEAFKMEGVIMSTGSTLTIESAQTVRNGLSKRFITIETLEMFLEKRVPDIQAKQVGTTLKLPQNPKITIADLHKDLPVYISNNTN